MAKRANKAYVGMRVYAPFAPQRAGIVTHVGDEIIIKWAGKPNYHTGNHYITVRWLTGESTENMSDSHVNDFDALIADHQKKLATHTVTLDRLKELQGAIDAI